MLIGLGFAGAVMARVPWWALGAAAVVFAAPALAPPAAVAAVAVAWWQRRPRRPSLADEVAFLQAVASELRGGASLRLALGAAAARVPELPLTRAVRYAAAGLPAEQTATELARVLPFSGRLAAAAYRLAAHTGARAADVFSALAGRAAEAAELDRERRAAAAQAKLSALVVGGAPMVLALGLLVTGRLRPLLDAGPVGVAIILAGMGLQLAGLATVVLLVRQEAP